MELAIIVPAYREEEHIVEVLNSIYRYVDRNDVIVVDDGGKDGTYTLAKGTGCHVIVQPINLGKGGALKTGCDYAFEEGAKKIICIDSDGQHDPKHLPELIVALDKYDVVYTYRSFNKKMPVVLRFGNRVLKRLGKFFYKVDIKDPQCGYRGFRGEAYQKLRWTTTGYAVENEIIFNMGHAGLTYTELPIETIYKDGYKGTNIIDGLTIFLNMLFWWMTRR